MTVLPTRHPYVTESRENRFASLNERHVHFGTPGIINISPTIGTGVVALIGVYHDVDQSVVLPVLNKKSGPNDRHSHSRTSDSSRSGILHTVAFFATPKPYVFTGLSS